MKPTTQKMPCKRKKFGEESERRGEEHAKRKSRNCFVSFKPKNYMHRYLEILQSAHA